jgi:hypothetical protein
MSTKKKKTSSLYLDFTLMQYQSRQDIPTTRKITNDSQCRQQQGAVSEA